MWAPPASTSAASEPTAITNRLISFTVHLPREPGCPLPICCLSPQTKGPPHSGDTEENYRGTPYRPTSRASDLQDLVYRPPKAKTAGGFLRRREPSR